MSIYQEKAKECKCCSKHVPLPTVLIDYNGIKVCPTTHSNIIELERIWRGSGSRPMGNIRKHFSEYVQDIVEKNINSDINDRS